MRIFADEKRAADALPFAVFTDGLRGREDMRLVERAITRRAAMPARAEADELVHISEIRFAFVVIAFEFRDINQQSCWSCFTGECIQSHVRRRTKTAQRCKAKNTCARTVTAHSAYPSELPIA